jgi:hypothetical protein
MAIAQDFFLIKVTLDGNILFAGLLNFALKGAFEHPRLRQVIDSFA